MRLLVLGPLALTLACSGPEAPDDALCRDVITRVCLARTCAGVSEQLALGTGDCQATLQERTGCASEDFAFSSPSRERILSCRLPLVRKSTDLDRAPSCGDVAEVLQSCPDVINFLGGRQP
ncbi:hypothetical protein [Hyalangium versicolor]|uniref:hypothetical protein n=1 Tax=Hyalangium versicolor TaxID=2861190 RepID=UPI001CC95708|nr:hypothetical protein [Hyalangium versicolor]